MPEGQLHADNDEVAETGRESPTGGTTTEGGDVHHDQAPGGQRRARAKSRPRPAAYHRPAGNGPVLAALGDIPPATSRYALDKIAAVIATIDEPTLFSRVKLAWLADPAVARRARAEAAVDVNGDLVRARVSATELHEAVDLLADRLRDRLQHRADRDRHSPIGREPEPGGWRHGNRPNGRAPFYERPTAEREVLRHKTYEPPECTLEEAAWDMTLADDQFVLFTELSNGVDAVLWRDGDAWHLHPLRPFAVEVTGTVVCPIVHANPVPRLSLADARDRLDNGGEPFVFFESDTTGRGNVLYRRYDGHYGLITPPAP